ERGLHAADMPPGLDALHDHGIGAGRVGVSSLLDRAALVQPDAGDAAPGRAPEGHECVRLACDVPVSAPSEREQQVDRAGLPGRTGGRASSARIAGGWRMPAVPSPPASETAAARSPRAIPPPIPACTTGSSTPRRSSNRTQVACRAHTNAWRLD